MHRFATLASSLLPALALCSPAASQPPPELKRTASDGKNSAQFGYSVALSKDTVVLGAIGDEDSGIASGSAYVFVRSGTTWSEQDKLNPGDPALEDSFGWSVAVSGDTAIVGSYLDDDAGDSSGSAYVFVRSGTTWSQQDKLTANDAAQGDRFGISVALSGDTAIVGASDDDDAGNNSGSAYVFVRSGTTWTQQDKLTANDAAQFDAFGASVALSGDTAIVGAEGDDDGGGGSGSAYVFVRSGTTWSQQDKLAADDAASGDAFGVSVALSGDTAIVGADSDDDAGNSSGSAYVFVRSGTTWSQQDKLTADDAAPDDAFGVSVAVDRDTAIVGADGDDDAGDSSGSAYVFLRNGTTWSQQPKITASDGAADDAFGTSVAVSGETALVGSPFDDDAGNLSGSAYLYDLALARVNEFGAGCAGTLALPVLQPAMGSLPKAGETFDVVLSSLPPGNRAFLILGLSNTQWLSMDLPMSLTPFGAPGCSLLVSGDFSTPVVNATGTATQGFPIPLDLSLIGLHIYFQGYVEDPGANLFGIAASNGLDIVIASR